MCCNFIENGMPKCFEYFSSTNSLVFDEFKILVLKEVSKLDFAIKRSILLPNSVTGNSKKNTHFHLCSWEDNSVPLTKEYFGVLNYAIFLIQHKLQKHLGKALIHCSAGIGRTGVVICIYELVTSLQCQLENTEVPSVSVFGTVRKLREQRWGMVATEAQYEFIYRFMDYWIAAYIYSNEN